jgi:membrane protein DedA with SNARE-associated domain
VVSASPATYAIVLLIVAVDALLPFAQAEAVVITAAVLAGAGHLVIWLVILVAALGGFVGDNISYFAGTSVGSRLVDRFFASGKRRERLKRAERGVRRQGGLLILVARFIPVGRTVTTLAAGTLGMPWPRFAVADGIAAFLWAVYASMLGYTGGSTFAHSLWKPLVFALAMAGVLALLAEGYRRLQKTRGRDILSGQLR